MTVLRINRLTGISGPFTASYVYNGDGERVRKTVESTTTYAWDPSGVGHILTGRNGYQYAWGSRLISQITTLNTRCCPRVDATEQPRRCQTFTSRVRARLRETSKA